jgi:hypothetical protein
MKNMPFIGWGIVLFQGSSCLIKTYEVYDSSREQTWLPDRDHSCLKIEKCGSVPKYFPFLGHYALVFNGVRFMRELLYISEEDALWNPRNNIDYSPKLSTL